MKDLIHAYQGYRTTNAVNDKLKNEMDMTVIDIMVLHEIYKTEGHISKTNLEKRLGLSKSVSQKITKQLRKHRMIIKDRDIDNESLVVLSMNDEMKQKAKEIFERVDKIYDSYKNSPQDKDEEQSNSTNDVDVNDDNKHQENPQNNFNHKKHHKN